MNAHPAPPPGENSPRPPRRRRAADDPRDYRVVVRLSAAERAEVEARAARLGLSLAAFVAEAALADDVMTLTQRRGLLAVLFRTQGIIGGAVLDIGALARVARSSGTIPAGLPAALAAIERACARMEAAIDGIEILISRAARTRPARTRPSPTRPQTGA